MIIRINKKDSTSRLCRAKIEVEMLMAKDNYEKLVRCPKHEFVEMFDKFISRLIDD